MLNTCFRTFVRHTRAFQDFCTRCMKCLTFFVMNLVLLYLEMISKGNKLRFGNWLQRKRTVEMQCALFAIHKMVTDTFGE